MKSPSAGLIGPRRLLRRLRDVMAGSDSAQERLNQVVKVIAADMVAEVCSIYILRAGEVLELFATEGLKIEAVHQTRLRVGEGLVGEIAAHAIPLNLSDAQSHPAFAYRPETGEEIYHSLMGVPILRGGRVVGVLVVQNKTRRQYAEEEVEALQITAMVLAELVASGDLVSSEERLPAEGNASLPVRLEGVALNMGIAMGRALLHQPDISIRQIVAEDPEAELNRLNDGMAKIFGAESPEQLIGKFVFDLAAPEEHKRILELQKTVDASEVSPLEEVKFLRLDGSVTYLERVGTPVIWNDKPSYLVIFRDVNARMRAQNELAQQKSFFEMHEPVEVITFYFMLK